MKRLLLVVAFILPCISFAMPEFPMAFWGSVTIDGSVAPVGTKVRAYESNQLTGEVTVLESGVYGYSDPLKQRLILSSGTGTIEFRVVPVGSSETGGLVAQTYSPGYVSGETVNKDLAFTLTSSSSGGGYSSGGGGGSSYVAPSVATPVVIPVGTTTVATTTPQVTSQVVEPKSSLGGQARSMAIVFYNLLKPLMSTNSNYDEEKIIGLLEKFFSGQNTAQNNTAFVRLPKFTQTLGPGTTHAEVKNLQIFLNRNGYKITSTGDGSPGKETTYFGNATRAALIKFQNANAKIVLAPYGLKAGNGYLGKASREYINKLMSEGK